MTVKYFNTWEDMRGFIVKNDFTVADFGLNDDWEIGKYYVTVWGSRKDS